MKKPFGYDSFRRRAGGYLRNRRGLQQLAREAAAKAVRNRDTLRTMGDDLMLLISMLRAWVSGDYRGVSWRTMVVVTTAVLYFVVPLDVIPDFIVALGFIDDAAVLAYVVAELKDEVDRFRTWLAERDSADGGTPELDRPEPLLLEWDDDSSDAAEGSRQARSD